MAIGRKQYYTKEEIDQIKKDQVGFSQDMYTRLFQNNEDPYLLYQEDPDAFTGVMNNEAQNNSWGNFSWLRYVKTFVDNPGTLPVYTKSQFDAEYGNPKNPGAWDVFYNKAVAKQQKVNDDVKSQVAVFNSQIANKDYANAEATLKNIGLLDPNYDVSGLQTQIDTVKSETDGNQGINQFQSALDNGLISQDEFNKLQNLYNTGLTDVAQSQFETYVNTNMNAAPAYDYTQDPAFQDIENISQGLRDVIAKGEPEFTAPTEGQVGEFTKPEFDETYVNKWVTQLQQLEEPTVDWALGKLNKQVSDAYMFSNPYSVGSGNQIEATQDASNDLLMSVVANRNAQALALGTADYENDYNKALTDYQYEVNKRDMVYNRDYQKAVADQQYQQTQLQLAQNKLLDISQYKIAASKMTSDQERQDYYAMLEQKWNTEAQQAQNEYNSYLNSINQQYATNAAQAQYNYGQMESAQQYGYAQQIANMYQPQGKEWYQTALESIVPAATSAFTYGATSSLFSPKKQNSGLTPTTGYYNLANSTGYQNYPYSFSTTNLYDQTRRS